MRLVIIEFLVPVERKVRSCRNCEAIAESLVILKRGVNTLILHLSKVHIRVHVNSDDSRDRSPFNENT